jgi:hypothetical protein
MNNINLDEIIQDFQEKSPTNAEFLAQKSAFWQQKTQDAPNIILETPYSARARGTMNLANKCAQHELYHKPNYSQN